MNNTLRLLFTLFTILCCSTISGASIQETHSGVVFEKACVLEGETGFSGSFKAPKTGLGNPFKNKTAAQIDEMFKKKGFTKSGPDPAGGTGGYVNPKTGRSYHIDPKDWGKYPEPNHVDVNRLRDYKGPLEKKKLPYKEN